MFGGTGISTVRGITANASQKNFDSSAPSLQGGMNYDSFNLERMDFARGPNAILFGAGGMGGTTNAVGKQARLNHRSTSVGLETGSWYHKRVTLDHNQPLGRKVALRLNAVWQDEQGWQDYTYTNHLLFIDELLRAEDQESVAKTLNLAASSDAKELERGVKAVREATGQLALIRQIQGDIVGL